MDRQPSDSEVKRREVKRHFEDIASEYDRYKAHAAYYHQQLIQLVKELIPDPSQRFIAEIGCGTGTILAALNPEQGLGIDISEEMVKRARERFRDQPNLRFKTGEAENVELPAQFDTVIMLDVLEHLYDSKKAIENLGKQMTSGSLLIISWANNLWTPILFILEKLKMKMPEGEHDWEPYRKVIRKLEDARFEIQDCGTRCLIPAAVPGADRINKSFCRWPVLKHLGLIRYIVSKRK